MLLLIKLSVIYRGPKIGLPDGPEPVGGDAGEGSHAPFGVLSVRPLRNSESENILATIPATFHRLGLQYTLLSTF